MVWKTVVVRVELERPNEPTQQVPSVVEARHLPRARRTRKQGRRSTKGKPRKGKRVEPAPRVDAVAPKEQPAPSKGKGKLAGMTAVRGRRDGGLKREAPRPTIAVPQVIQPKKVQVPVGLNPAALEFRPKSHTHNIWRGAKAWCNACKHDVMLVNYGTSRCLVCEGQKEEQPPGSSRPPGK